MRRSLAFVSLLTLVAAGITAQQRPSLESRFDAATYAALRQILENAQSNSVPLGALESKALEGAAKRRPTAQIVAAVRQLAMQLKDARTLLQSAVPDARLADGEIVAAAEAVRRGVPGEEIAALRRNAPSAASLEIPFAILGELVQRNIPADQGRAVIEDMLRAEVEQVRMVEIPARVDVALRVGAPPVAALGSALQGLGIPVPAVIPGRRRPRRPQP